MARQPPVILIVDDNVDLAENLAELLEEDGYKTMAMTDPKAVLAKVKELDFDAAILDIRMPEIDGVDVLAELKKRFPEARFVMMTAHAADPRIELAHSLGINALLYKPIPFDELFEQLPAVAENTKS
jgi:CheY-like chemotaxis protein